jgi:hypothetical protein
MSKASRRNDRDSTGSGHGALGMGGQPSDDPRDLSSGRESLPEDDRGSGTGPVPGAFGSWAGKVAGSSGNETVGVPGDRAFDDVQKTRRGK